MSDLTERAKDATLRASASLQQAVMKGTGGARKHRTKLIIAAGMLVVGVIVVRSWTRR